MRQPRIVIPDVPHHVTTRGNNRRRLFSYPYDYQRMLRYIGDALGRFDVSLLALVLMTNHLHLLLIPRAKEALSGFMQSFEQRYARYRNRKRRSSGKLFEERYFSVPIASEAQLALTLSYVELNPVRAGLKPNPADYPWSTCRLHLARSMDSKVSPDIWTPSDWYLEQGRDAGQRARAFQDWVTLCHKNDLQPEQWKELVEFEALSAKPYTLRLERPDRSRASEAKAHYRKGTSR